MSPPRRHLEGKFKHRYQTITANDPPAFDVALETWTEQGYTLVSWQVIFQSSLCPLYVALLTKGQME